MQPVPAKEELPLHEEFPSFSENTPDIITYECEEVTEEELKIIWNPETNPAYAKQLEQ